jgi:hypothetical protein
MGTTEDRRHELCNMSPSYIAKELLSSSEIPKIPLKIMSQHPARIYGIKYSLVTELHIRDTACKRGRETKAETFEGEAQYFGTLIWEHWRRCLDLTTARSIDIGGRSAITALNRKAFSVSRTGLLIESTVSMGACRRISRLP